MPQASKPKKIAILGGGMAGLTAAFELTRDPDWKRHYEVTVYQQGWRLGGKCASGRNADEHFRNEEHGFHVFMGFYENALRMLEDCYKELRRGPGERFATMDQAFEAHDDIHFLEDIGGEQQVWPLKFKPRKKRRRLDFDQLWSRLDTPLKGLLPEFPEKSDAERLLDLLLERLGLSLGTSGMDGEVLPGMDQVLDLLRPEAPPQEIPQDKNFPLLAHGLLARARTESQEQAQASRALVIQGLERLREEQWGKVGDVPEHDERRRQFILINLGTTIALGLAKEGLRGPDADLSKLDAYDFRDWLKKHNARPESYDSAIVKAGYNLTFSRAGGLAAGAALQGLLLMLDYQEHLYFKMNAGMGEVVIAPLYLVLKQRGVKFEFFHSVESLRLGEDPKQIAAIDVSRQVALAGSEYDPLIHVDGLPCWPVAPRYEQLLGGEALKQADFEAPQAQGGWTPVEQRTLLLGRDFDFAVLAIPVGALEPLCTHLFTHNPRLRRMVTSLKTTATQASQLWFSRSLEDDARWKRKGGVLACCASPFDTWADSTQVLDTEKWEPGHQPRSLVYLCGPLEEEPSPPGLEVTHLSVGAPPSLMDEAVRSTASLWLEKTLPIVWPESSQPSPQSGTEGTTPQEHLPPGKPEVPSTMVATRPGALLDEYHRASIRPSDRYVLSVPGSTEFRLRANESGHDNLLLAGDWVRTRLNTGCVEAAVMAGQQAAQALTSRLRPRAVARLPLPPPPQRRQPARYIEGRGLATWRGPFRQGLTRLHSFFIECEYTALRRLCDVYFNDLQDKAEYRPIGSFAIVQCARINESTSLDPTHKSWGSMKEREIAITIPVVGGEMVDGEFQPDRFLLFAPYLFVDTGVAMAVGREIYGFAKQLGTVTMPEEWEQPASFAVSSMVVSQPGQRAEMRELLSIHRQGNKALKSPEGDDSFDSDTSAFSRIIQTLLPHVHIDGLPAGLDQPQAMLFLKQFRDAENTTRACYQAIVEAPFLFSNFRGGGLLPSDFTLRIHSHYSHPIVEELGMKPESAPLLATVLDLDFDLDNGRVIWSTGE